MNILNDSTTQRLNDSTTQRLNDSTTQRLNDSTTQRLNDSTTQRLNDSTTQRLNDSTTQRLNDSTTQRLFLTSSLALLSFLFLSLLFSCTGSASSDPSPSTGSDTPANITATISFTGIQALELTVGSDKDTTISTIVRLSNEATPIWTNIENKVGLLTRNLIANTPKRIFTAKHYDTQDALKTNIGAMRAADFLQTNTAYKVYIFRDENLVNTLDFSTLTLPAAADWDETEQFIDGTFPYRENIYQIDVQEGSVVLMPVYWKELIDNQGIQVNNPTPYTVYSCQLPSSGGVCLPNSIKLYALEQSFEHTNVTADTYVHLSFAIKQFTTTIHTGRWVFKDGADGRARNLTVNAF